MAVLEWITALFLDRIRKPRWKQSGEDWETRLVVDGAERHLFSLSTGTSVAFPYQLSPPQPPISSFRWRSSRANLQEELAEQAWSQTFEPASGKDEADSARH